MEIKSALRAAGAAFAIALAAPAAARERGETVAPHFERVIPNIPGKSLVAVVVDYAPGGASLPHTHAKSAFIFAYVVSGAIESQVNDQPKRGLPRRRELVRDTRFQPSRQPQCKRDRARKVARGFRRRYRGQDPDHPGSIRPDVQGVK
jgi:hypothetical protein